MILILLAATVLVGLVGWGVWESLISHRAHRDVTQQQRQERAADAQRVTDERRSRIARNPMNAVFPFLWQNGPARVRKAQAVQVAEGMRDQADEGVRRVVTGFKGGVEPTFRQRNLLLTLSTWWLVALVAQAGLDFPVFRALTGGNGVAAAFLTVAIAAAMAGAPLLYDYVRHSRQPGEGSDPTTRGTLVAVICLSVLLLGILVWLAPRRADAMYDAQIESKNNSIAAARAPGMNDKTGITAYTKQLEQLKADRTFAGEAFQAITVAAAVSEFGAGLAVMGGLQVLQLGAARRRQKRAEKGVRNAKNDEAVFTAAIPQAMAAPMIDAGLEPVVVNAVMQEHARSAAQGQPTPTEAIPGPPPPEPARPTPPEPARPTPPDSTPTHPLHFDQR